MVNATEKQKLITYSYWYIMLNSQHLLLNVTFLRFKRIFSHIILLIFFKENTVTQDMWTKNF